MSAGAGGADAGGGRGHVAVLMRGGALTSVAASCRMRRLTPPDVNVFIRGSTMASKRGKMWRGGRIYLPNGRERTKTFATKREATRWEKAERDQPAVTVETLAEFVTRTQGQVLATLSPSTAATYRSHLRQRVLPSLGHRRMTQIHTGHVEAAAAEWSSTGVSSSSVSGSLNCLSRFYRHAIKWRQMDANPVRAAERPRPDPERAIPTLTAAEVDLVADRCAAVKVYYGGLCAVGGQPRAAGRRAPGTASAGCRPGTTGADGATGLVGRHTRAAEVGSQSSGGDRRRGVGDPVAPGAGTAAAGPGADR